MNRHIPFVVSEGTPFARGKHLGDVEQQRICFTIRAYMKLFKQLMGLNPHDVLSKAEHYIPTIRSYAPHLFEEMRGIAEGAGCDLREVVAINARTELLAGRKGKTECTAIGVTSSASPDGHLRLAQNWDWYPTLIGTAILWAIHRDDGPDVMTLTEAGIVGKIGINAVGLAMCINLLSSDYDYLGVAVPMHIILRSVLERASTVEEAIAVIAETERSTSCHHLLGDTTGMLASVEATPHSQSVIRQANGVLTHTNHCLNTDLFLHDTGARNSPETLARHERVHALARKHASAETDISTVLADHANAPNSICLHDKPDLPLEKRGESIASIILDITSGTVEIADGPPCCTPYRQISLSTYLKADDRGIKSQSWEHQSS